MSTAGKLLPVPNRTESFWLTERDPHLKAARTTPDLPSSADVLIIGSGLSGAMMAYHLTRKSQAQGKKLKIVMIEADECCGSATARNGGHCKPHPFVGYRLQKEKHGAQIANDMFIMEEEALGKYVKLVMEEDIDCDLAVTRAFDVFYLEDDAREAKLDLEARYADFPDGAAKSDIKLILDPAEMQRRTGAKGAKMGATYPAGHLWPYKLATSLIRIAMRGGMNLQTYTPALSMESVGSKWTVETSRGKITADQVVVATNAYTSSVLPEFKPLIIPIRGTACSITPPPSHQPGGEKGPFKYTFGFRHGPGEVDYFIPRQGRGRIPGNGNTSLIFGGAKGTYLRHIDRWYNNHHDDVVMPGVREYFEGYMSKHFEGWEQGEGSVDHVWSGVLGYSADLRPLIGAHPTRPGVFVIAGHTGHGMPRIPGSAEALSTLMLDSSLNAQSTFERSIPKPYWLTAERLQAKWNGIQTHMGQGRKAAAAADSDEAAMLDKIVRAKL